MRKLTTQDFITKAQLTHGMLYDYSQSVYAGSNTPLTIHCTTHGGFRQRPTDHYHGQGCPKCGKLSQADTRRRPVDDFIKQAMLVHNNKYDYSKVVYINTHTHVTITCPKHGDFSQKPNTHISRRCGCPVCANEHHPGRYMEHRFGSSIPTDTPGVFYVIRFSNHTETFIKIGITKTTAKQRHAGKHSGYEMTVLHEHKTTLLQALQREEDIKSTLSAYRYIPLTLKEGRTECFTEAVLPLIGL